MIIDIQKIPVLWTTCEKSKSRWEDMERMLKDLKVSSEKIVGPITNPYPVGVAKGYIQALQKYPAPFAIFEDDATIINPNYVPTCYSLPEDADAFYLGTTLSGRIKKQTIQRTVIAASIDAHIMRIFNMLAFHAVIYTSQRYVDYCIQILNEFLKNPVGGCDDPIADNMWRHNIYSVKVPIFYQKDGRNDAITKEPVDILL